MSIFSKMRSNEGSYPAPGIINMKPNVSTEELKKLHAEIMSSAKGEFMVLERGNKIPNPTNYYPKDSPAYTGMCRYENDNHPGQVGFSTGFGTPILWFSQSFIDAPNAYQKIKAALEREDAREDKHLIRCAFEECRAAFDRLKESVDALEQYLHDDRNRS